MELEEEAGRGILWGLKKEAEDIRGAYRKGQQQISEPCENG
jgi:hypothetical protein